ncbi:MAG: hypothetical protein Q7U66_15850 [Methylobacter sp.]|nr:hypothetical protein [Methylobacter sp.]
MTGFRRWFAPFDEAVWDMQIEADALAAEALAEYHNGWAREL